MTRHKLESLHTIRKSVSALDKRALELKRQEGDHTQELRELNLKKSRLLREYEKNKAEIEKYIDALDCLSARLVELRVIRDYSWIRAAAEIGGGNSDASLRKRYWRIVRGLPMR